MKPVFTNFLASLFMITPLTAMGRLYRDHESVPALKDWVWLGANNLSGPEIEERSR